MYKNIIKKRKVASQRNTRENKIVLQKVDIAEALTNPGVSNGAHQHMVTPRGGSSEGCSVRGVEESLEYEDIQTETKLEDCALVEVEMRNGEVGMKYVKDGEARWTSVVRRKTSARSDDGDNSGNLNKLS